MQTNDGLDANERWISDITRISSPRWPRRIQHQKAVIETAMLNKKDGKRDLKVGENRKEVDLAQFLLEDIMRMAYVWCHYDNEDPVEELPRCSAQKIHQKNIAEKFNETMHEHSTRRPRVELLGIQKSHKTMFPGLEFGSRVSRNDYVPSYGSLILGFRASEVTTPLELS
ncbi:hypothetical protein HID58_013629 [Brassica napus]|uniref:Uncharacterized protein n=1 Tax=Brassica napus TaxID=3708 RepID=A0ABQ8E4G5_BRANA|nr:hypothetical protein HID58_013629 [Brassica napus]